jgi:transposase InsO family protein
VLHPATRRGRRGGVGRYTDDSYDNALAEAFNSLFKAELVRNKGPWRSIDDLEIAVAEYIDWFNHRRLHGEIGIPARRVRRRALPAQPRADYRRRVAS